MIVHVPPSLQEFCQLFSSGLTKVQRTLLPALLSVVLLGRGKRSLANLARGVKTVQRDRSSMSRLFRRDRFRTRDLVAEVCRGMIEKASTLAKAGVRVWFLTIDGTATRRGSYTKIANALQYREKVEGKNSPCRYLAGAAGDRRLHRRLGQHLPSTILDSHTRPKIMSSLRHPVSCGLRSWYSSCAW